MTSFYVTDLSNIQYKIITIKIRIGFNYRNIAIKIIYYFILFYYYLH